MRVVDSSAWVESLSDTPTAETLVDHMPDEALTIDPTIVQLELAKWLAREVSDEAADEFIAQSRLRTIVPLDTTIAIRVAEVSRDHKLATADAIIYATALQADADLLTCDSHFEGLEHVLYVPKSRACPLLAFVFRADNQIRRFQCHQRLARGGRYRGAGQCADTDLAGAAG